MNDKKWKEILDRHPDYFAWAVGNTMGRETKTFKVLLAVLPQDIQVAIQATQKGQYSPKKKVDDASRVKWKKCMAEDWKPVDWTSYEDQFPPMGPPVPLKREKTIVMAPWETATPLTR